MEKVNKPEVWLRGALPNVPQLLQPVAHALLQAREEINSLMIDFPEALLWESVAGMASVGFHLQHLTGVLDRLFTYAADKSLNDDQLIYLSKEGKDQSGKVNLLVTAFNNKVDWAIDQLKQINEQTLTETRGVGRAQIPSTVIGLLVHSAEHTMRHAGQLLVTVSILKAGVK
jgi:uncharacterized damage-inducible protein DinB